jgi:hypothetical protein
MTNNRASYAQKHDEDGYDDWINDLLRDTPEVWEASEGSAESIITEYLHTLEQRVIAAYGPDGLEPDHEGVAETITALEEMRAIRDWVTHNLPHVDTTDGVAKPIITMLTLVQTSVTSILPVFQSIISVLEPQFRALGLANHHIKKEGNGR